LRRSNNENEWWSNPDMKKLFSLPVIISLAIFCSCQKQQTEEERKAEVERQVQERLAAERQAQSEQQLAQREADLEAREKALAAEKEQVAESPPVAEALQTPLQSSRTDNSGNVATASYSTFYRKLDPYGVWRETPNYGYVWQPQEAERSRSWRPYTNGRWVYTDAGWTWISEEPFGWATYHYGRWTRLRNIGWVWVPGDEWAPAWVSWRKGND
jgi:type II secretory pathway pseudopilin PulG